MQELCRLCKNYAKIMQKLCKNYAKITQKKLRKNYAYVCKLHNLHYYAPPTLLMDATRPSSWSSAIQSFTKLYTISCNIVQYCTILYNSVQY